MSKSPVLPPPTKALALLRHLADYGEITADEAKRLGGVEWLGLLCQASLLHQEGNCWAVKPGFVSLFPAGDIDLLRRVCFRVPSYHTYLVRVLAQNLVGAARDYDNARLEMWILRQMPELAGEINGALDCIGVALHGQSLLDAQLSQLKAAWVELSEGTPDFSAWDRELVGTNGTAEEIFTAVLDKLVPLVKLSIASEIPDLDRLAFLPQIPIGDVTANLSELARAPWAIKRIHVDSGLGLFDADGRTLFDSSRSVDEILRQAFAHQPYYFAVLQLLIAQVLGNVSGQVICLKGEPGNGDLTVLRDGRELGKLSDMLPALVRSLGFSPITYHLPLATNRIGNLLENLQRVRIASIHDGELRLFDDYVAFLFSQAGKWLLRQQSKRHRAHMLSYLYSL